MSRIWLSFLKDRLSWILLVWIVFFLVFGYKQLFLFFGHDGSEWFLELPYLLLLVSIILVAFLIAQFIRYYPYYRWLDKLKMVQSVEDWTWITGPGQEGKWISEVINHFQDLVVKEMESWREQEEKYRESIETWVHQMKTPISVLSLMAQEKEAWRSPADRVAMEEEVEKLNQGLNLILHLARLRTFSIDVQLKPVSLVPVIRKLMNQHKRRLIRYRIFPKLDCKEEDIVVFTDPKWNEFVLDQIFQNALKYMALSKRQGTIQWTIERQRDHVVLTLRDEGPGIPDYDLPRVFEPFFTGENGRIYSQSTGMGLYLVKKVIDLLGHQVTIDSNLGKGTIITIKYGIKGADHVSQYRMLSTRL